MHTRLLLLLGMMGCTAGTPPPPPNSPGPVFRSTGSSFAPGPLETQQRDVAEGEAGAPRPLRITAPREPGTYPVVQFHHGFLSERRTYDELLTRLASHGFVVVAPQLYPADGVPLGKPTAAEEARVAAEVARWSAETAATLVGAAADPRPIGVAGHSRGGKVSWLLALNEQLPVRALVGVDPVDGRGGPLLSAQPEALPDVTDAAPPSLDIGMERGGACAPEGDNFRHFFERTTPPSALLVVKGHGHGDMLDADANTGGLCFEGPHRDAVRTLTGGALTAFFRVHLQDDASAATELAAPSVQPLEVTHEAR
ncbi:MAG: alpha/beta fold hydrolase [Myxococcota bacterium]